MYGFSKNRQDNISYQEEDALRMLASAYLSLSEEEMDFAVRIGELIEVHYEEIDS